MHKTPLAEFGTDLTVTHKVHKMNLPWMRWCFLPAPSTKVDFKRHDPKVASIFKDLTKVISR